MEDRLYNLLIALTVVLGVIGAGLVLAQFAGLPQNYPQQISVSGIGKAYIKPDIAMVSFGVTTQELKSQDAVNKNNEKMNAVIKAIKDLGIDEKDIQTTLYNLTPMYDYGTITDPVPMMESVGGSSDSGVVYPMPVRQGQIFRGYSLEQQISVKIRDFEKINSVLDKATSTGATNVGQLQFTVDDPEKANAEARALAIENAKEKMQSLAKQSGLRVGKLVNVSEGYNNYPVPMYTPGMGGATKDSVGIAPEIQTGQQEINLTVTLTYQVK